MRRRGNAGRLVLTAAAIAASVMVVAAAGCARGVAAGGTASGETAYRAVVSLPPDSTLRIARTQLEHHGYKVSEAGPNSIVTLPAAIPEHLQDKSGATKGRYWVLRISADGRALRSGTDLTVMGYVLPPAAARPANSAAPPPAEAVVVTSENRALFGEVQAAGKWVQDEAWRNRKRK